MNHVLPSGSSVSGWLVVPSGGSHASTATLDYVANGGSSGCTQCHGSDLSGGISGVSCFGNPAGCHHVPVSGWAAAPPAAQQHGVSAKKAPGSSGFASCQICHGSNFSGGGANQSCLNNSACHGAGVASPHAPKPWRGSPYTHTDTNTANAPVCALCHYPGSPNNPANHPATPAPAGTAPGCFNSTLCHESGGVAHPVPFNDNAHYNVVTATFAAACDPCHDVSAPTTKVGPVCQTCHVAASPLTSANCTSCHASPPNGGAGAVYANIAGAHTAHIALDNAGSPISCDTCHAGLGPSLLNLNHYNRAKSRVPPGDVAFLATYTAKTGASSFDNTTLSCSNVSCHGGQATPNWQTGTLDVNTQCTNCHALGSSQGNPQYNSEYSGEHQFHFTQLGNTAAACKKCHNTTTLAVNHFSTLNTTALEGPASATVGGGSTRVTYVPATRTCTPSGSGCHGSHTW
jgi:predicted CxxxxCH...CXXCH cytochrome family protein